VGDKYEGGARYFALSSEEIGKKVERLISRMSLQEIYDYITDLHKNIDDNYKKSDMVKQVNLKLMNSLYNQTFERIKKEQASTRDIIDFVKVLTGR
jgi:Na+/phosphate symporter